MLEAIAYILLVISKLLLLSVSQAYVNAGASGASIYPALGALLVTSGDWIGQILAIVFSIGALMINYLFYRLKNIPRWLSGWGFIGAILYFAAPYVSMLGSQHLTLSLDTNLGFLMAPLAVQEIVFAVWVIVKGFNPPESSLQTV